MIKNHFILMAAMAFFAAIGCKSANQEKSGVTLALVEMPDSTKIVSEIEPENMLAFSSSLNNTYYQPGKTNEGYLFLNLEAMKYEAVEKERMPLNIAIVIDRSGSMSGDKINYVKEAAKFIVDQLSQSDYVSIVIYDDVVEVIHKAGIVENKELIKNKIDKIKDRNMTNLSGGMIEGYNQVKNVYKPGFINRVLLLTDGLANAGITNPEKLQKIAEARLKEDGITLSTFGVGLDFNEDLMTGLAENGSGNYYFIASPENIPAIFEKELSGLLHVVAQNVLVTLELPDFVTLEKCVGYKYEVIENKVLIAFKDVFSEDKKAVLIKFKINASSPGQLMFNSSLSYDDALSEAMQRKEIKVQSVLKATSDIELMQENINIAVSEQIILFESNELLEKAMKEVDKGAYENARELVKKNKAYLDSNAVLVEKNVELKKQATVNAAYEEKIKNAESMNDNDKKMLQKSSKSSNYEIRKKK